MPVVNNQLIYQTSGEYSGTIITAPASLPDPAPPVQSEPNIVKPTLDSTGSATTPPTAPIRTNLGFGYIEVPGQNTIVANRYMSTVIFEEGNNMTITTNASDSTITFSAAGSVTSVGLVAGNSIAISGGPVTGSGNITVTNTFTETVFDGGNVSGTLTPDRNNGTIQKFTLTGNITLEPATNMAAGQSLTLILTQDVTGGRDLTANSAYYFAGAFNTLSNGGDEIDMLNMFYDGSKYYVTLTVGYSNA